MGQNAEQTAEQNAHQLAGQNVEQDAEQIAGRDAEQNGHLFEAVSVILVVMGVRGQSWLTSCDSEARNRDVHIEACIVL